MKRIIPIILAAILFAIACNNNDDGNTPDDPDDGGIVVELVKLPVTINATISGSTFADGDILVISNSEILAAPATLNLTDLQSSTSAVFSGDVTLREGLMLIPGESTLTAVLSHGGEDIKTSPLSEIKAVNSIADGLEQYGGFSCRDFIYYAESMSIEIVQSAVFVQFDVNFHGAKVLMTTTGNKFYRKYINGDELFAVPSGTVIQSQILDVSETLESTDEMPTVYTIARTLPDDCIPGVFSVSGTRQVFFSKGNLQYRPSDGSWRLAPEQYDHCFSITSDGRTNSIVGDDHALWQGADDWTDLFGCGTWLIDGNPLKTSQDNGDYMVEYDDWGMRFVAPPAVGSEWSTLTIYEWNYLSGTDSECRPNAERLCKWTTVRGINGLVILPDNCADAIADDYDEAQWAAAEEGGALFLPTAGYRLGTAVYYVGDYGIYWSDSFVDEADGGFQYGFYFGASIIAPYPYDRCGGQCVRLVRSE